MWKEVTIEGDGVLGLECGGKRQAAIAWARGDA